MLTWFLLEKRHIFIMVKRCVVQFCSNLNKTGYTIHKFPKDANLRRQWVIFVQVKRANLVAATEHSAIWNIHLCPDCNKESFMVEIRLEGCFRSCLQQKMAAQLGHVYQEKHSINEQVADRQLCIEISYTKSTEK